MSYYHEVSCFLTSVAKQSPFSHCSYLRHILPTDMTRVPIIVPIVIPKVSIPKLLVGIINIEGEI